MKNLRNKVMLIGNLGTDPEVTEFNNGKKKAKFRVATTDFYKDLNGNRKEETQWHNVVAWDGLANIVQKYVKKGREVAIEGKLIHRSYEATDGSKRYVTEIVANDLVMLRGAQ